MQPLAEVLGRGDFEKSVVVRVGPGGTSHTSEGVASLAVRGDGHAVQLARHGGAMQDLRLFPRHRRYVKNLKRRGSNSIVAFASPYVELTTNTDCSMPSPG